jgi:hypothetical protein
MKVIAANLAEIEISADLPPEERARLEALYGQVLDKAIQLAARQGRSTLSTTG